MNSTKSGSREKVRVVVRVRPFNNKELQIASSTTCIKLQEQSLEISVDEALHNFQFDRVFGPDSTQLEVFDYTATPLIIDVLSGYNATIFAYGQTGNKKSLFFELFIVTIHWNMLIFFSSFITTTLHLSWNILLLKWCT